jgi:hypothetical protein
MPTKVFDAFTRLDASDVNAYLANKSISNNLINGAFDIWQRGTTFSATTASTFTSDRWMSNPGGDNTTISRQTGNPSISSGNFALRYQRDLGRTNTNNKFLAQSLPNLDSAQLVGKTVTLSFWAKKGANYSQVDSGLTVFLYSSTGTDQNFITVALTGQVTVATSTVTLDTTLERYSVTGTVPSNATQVHAVFRMTPVGTAGANDWYELEGVQLEEGTVANDFRRNANSIQGELAACQRYYVRATGPGSQRFFHNSGAYTSNTNCFIGLGFPVEMRVAPTSVESGGTLGLWEFPGDKGITGLALTAGVASTKTLYVTVTVSSGGVAGKFVHLQALGDASAFLAFSAEL